MGSSADDSMRSIWRNADAVCFDVDSTVCQDEGIDELAKFCGKYDEVSKLTKEAMTGKMEFKEALRKRLSIIRPTLNQMRDLIRTRPPKLTPGIRELVSALQHRKIPVYLISGGFRGLVGPVALELNIPLQNIYANRLKFFLNGEYAGFDEEEPTSRSGGKGEVVRYLKAKNEYTNVVLIGDGATDLEACPPADAFIGFGGNVVREEVRAKAKWFVTDFQELINALD
ncbi:phosphoserine phosphatase [Neocloeon triangulifer]|uniref:phosphoserine phosphatase n=1 Tax=Neocloeon triangulifer TaxID=2078957 RepID=UPI00286EFF37|nr:phosphoserine phosphatase [Neocloeon triangulifer]XP_059482322.1 phosphoserine phosphatase [Neocloeon triangulifer]XP_059482323.1 phosphoserine phosphatase [Neocloeon triangulifer]